MRTIFKYSIPIQGYFHLQMPKDAKILSFQIQMGEPVIWALVNPGEECEQRDFSIKRTGIPIQYDDFDKNIFIGTIQMGALSRHLFEEEKGPGGKS